MKMTKKLLAILLSVCLIGSLFVGMASAANSNVGFTVSATTVEVGDTVEVEIYNNAANLQGMGLWLSFDTSLLSLQSVTGVDGSDVFGAYAGSILYPAQVAEVNGGLFSFGVFGAANGSDFSAGTIATLTFVATGEGVATFELSEDSAGEDGYTGGVNAASVTIKEKQTPVDPPVDPEEPKDSPYFVYDPSGCNGGPNCPSHKFTDVDHTQWYHEGIDFVVANKIMAGVSDTLFGTHDTTTRGMIVTILYRMAGEPALKGKNVFTDVANDTWYTKAVIWAKENNIVAGVSADEFAPNAAITREQMATMLYNFAKYMGYDVSNKGANMNSFADSGKISGYAKTAMQWACAEGLIAGTPVNGVVELQPQGNAERCQVSSIIMRFCKTFMK